LTVVLRSQQDGMHHPISLATFVAISVQPFVLFQGCRINAPMRYGRVTVGRLNLVSRNAALMPNAALMLTAETRTVQ
jgi:hypothetical protein